MTINENPLKLLGIRCAADIIRGSKDVVLLSGAGISTPSGIPDFRSPTSGIWHNVNPEEVASLDAFRHTPAKFFGWLRGQVETIVKAKPNSGHFELARLQKAGYIQTIITQNIDNLHQRSGAENVLEVHGTLTTMTCVSCFRRYNAMAFLPVYLESGEIPQCTECHQILKPDVVLYGEQLPVKTWLKAVEVSKRCDLMIVVGSSLEVLPVANLPMQALENGAHLILINQSHTYLDVRADVIFHEDVMDIIPRIVEEVLGE